MAICEACKQEMSGEGCSCLPKISLHGKIYDRIKYGDETRFDENWQPAPNCHDCNCRIGDYHHLNCDMEESPITHKQLLIETLGLTRNKYFPLA